MSELLRSIYGFLLLTGLLTSATMANTDKETLKFGKYKLRIAGEKPSFDDGLKYYDKLYGSEATMITMKIDRYLWSSYIALGLGGKVGYYSDDGHAADSEGTNGQSIEKSNPDESLIQKDEENTTNLKLLPFQFGLTGQSTFSRLKYVVFDFFLGVEGLYFQEVRTSTSDTDSKSTSSSSTASSTTSTETSTSTTTATEETGPTGAYTNKGWKYSMVLAVAANILLNPLEPKAARGLERSLGFGHIYFTPFVEIVRSVGSSGVSFGRTSLGLGFTFESK